MFKPPAPQEEQVRTGLLYSKMPGTPFILIRFFLLMHLFADHILKYFSLEDSNKAPPAATTAFPTVLDGHSQPNSMPRHSIHFFCSLIHSSAHSSILHLIISFFLFSLLPYRCYAGGGTYNSPYRLSKTHHPASSKGITSNMHVYTHSFRI